MLDQTLTNFFKSNRALQADGPLIVAVSGGRDSLCLLHWLTHSTVIHAEIIAVTIDHGLRPESAAECKAVSDFAIQWGAECQIKQTLLTPETFTENNGRIARYAILRDAATQANAHFIFTGHHAGDQAETVLLHLLRGTGLTGLTGIRPRTYLTDETVAEKDRHELIRPMLTVTPEMLDVYASENNLQFVQDPSNDDDAFTRNRIRNQLMPQLEDQFNSQVQKALGQMAGILQDDLETLNALHAQAWENSDQDSGLGWCSLNFEGWYEADPSFQRYALRQLYSNVFGSTQDLTLENLEAARRGLLNKKTDKRYQLSGLIWVQKAYDTLLAYHHSAAESFDMPQIRDISSDQTFSVGVSKMIDNLKPPWQLHVSYCDVEHVDLTESAENRWVAYLSIEKGADLILRGRHQSEAFRPFRFNGDVYLKKLMIDRKIPAILRDRWPLIADGTGVLWVAGHRLAARAAITSKTEHAVRVEIKKSN